jgi:dihydropteroate synthase
MKKADGRPTPASPAGRDDSRHSQPAKPASGIFRIMGVVNITPDSFSDGGRYLLPDAALAQAKHLVEAGAEVIDLGAESTRPGALPVNPDEEWRRLEPVIKALMGRLPNAIISTDTRKPDIMLKAAAAGARLTNNVGLLPDDATLAKLAATPGMQYVAMHMHGEPSTMQRQPLAPDAAIAAVDAYFQTAMTRLTRAGFSPDRIWLDPGFGFGKSDAANLAMMRQLPAWSRQYQIAVGVSRKSLIGRMLNIEDPAARDEASHMLELGLVLAGAKLVRTHDVAGLSKVRSFL